MTRLLASTALAASLSLGTYAVPQFVGQALAKMEDTTSTGVKKCKGKKVYDSKSKKCVKAEKSSSLSDDDVYAAVKRLAYSRKYDQALDVLDLAKDAQTPRMLTQRGFITRKMGDVEAAFPYYRSALAMDPSYTLAREYMGEAYIQLGRVDLAREQLEKIAEICGTDCGDYRSLAKQIEVAG
jgi:tetratricopeptide (TPR) repeat protein